MNTAEAGLTQIAWTCLVECEKEPCRHAPSRMPERWRLTELTLELTPPDEHIGERSDSPSATINRYFLLRNERRAT
jgi:hypothetical protein